MNKEIAQIFSFVADILEFNEANVFRISAYRRAARVIGSLPKDVAEMYDGTAKSLTTIDGIGQGLALDIEQYIKNGKVGIYEELRKKIPAGLLDMISLRGLGPKKVKKLYKELGVKSLAELKKACTKHEVCKLDGMGEKTETELLDAIAMHAQYSKRTRIDVALAIAEDYISYLKKNKKIKRVNYAGSLRRRKETIGDVDIICEGERSMELMDYFVAYPRVTKVTVHGEKKTSVIIDDTMSVDFRVYTKKEYGAALSYTTGSKEHNVRLRELLKAKGYKLNEYGVFRGNKYICCEDEEGIYNLLKMQYIPPELREDWGEVGLALQHKIPRLIELSDIKGDLHMHTTWSDGDVDVATMVAECKRLKYKYNAISDHSQSLTIANGLNSKRIAKQVKEIKSLQDSSSYQVLCGSEVDILKTGKLDHDDKVLAKLDIVIASMHKRFKNLSRAEQTERLLKVVTSGKVNILGHPTGRLVGEREEIGYDREAVFLACAKNNVALEINGQPKRLDISDGLIRLAKKLGCKFVISSDAHSPKQLGCMRYGVFMARRGGLAKEDVVNTYSLAKLRKFFAVS